jgi:hypothetical protein
MRRNNKCSIETQVDRSVAMGRPVLLLQAITKSGQFSIIAGESRRVKASISSALSQ